jgi:hypothetical protein
MTSIEELRAEARRLTQAVNTVSDPRTKEELAARALELSQRAEALEKAMADPWLLRANINRYRSLFGSGTLSDDQTRVVQEMLADAERLLGNSKKQAP